MSAKLTGLQFKEKQVNDLTDSIRKAKTLMIASIKGLPSKQFQEIKKSIREHADVRVAKKNIMVRALKGVGKESILKLEEHVGADCAFIISDLEGFELAGILAKKKTPVFAKAGQIAPEDIEVKEGPTDLVPGPAISELGALGLQVAVQDGKISIKQSKVVIKEGQEIDENAASLFQKLNILPFNVGLDILASYDVHSEKIYTEIKIDPEEYTKELQTATGKALGFAQKIAYYCKETIGYLLAKANADFGVLEKLVPEKVDEKVEDINKDEEKVDENTDNSEEGKEEEPSDSGKTESAEDKGIETSKPESDVKEETEEVKEVLEEANDESEDKRDNIGNEKDENKDQESEISGESQKLEDTKTENDIQLNNPEDKG